MTLVYSNGLPTEREVCGPHLECIIMQTSSGEDDCFDGEGVIFSTLDKFRCLGEV